jgi:pimeloyl-ACP methyl ester carboxylesterase
LWSPHWQFDAETFERTAKSFDNADFVDVVIQSYRHRYAYAAGDPALEPIEQQLVAQPAITVPTIVLHGEADGIQPVGASLRHAAKFTGFYERRTIVRAGHNLPQEVPEFVCKATLELLART